VGEAGVGRGEGRIPAAGRDLDDRGGAVAEEKEQWATLILK
jgi:hypothetical protein